MNQMSGHEEFPRIIEAHWVDARVVVFDFHQASHLYRNGFFGLPLGIKKPRMDEFERPLELSLLEAAYLLEKGLISLKDLKSGRPISLVEFKELARERDDQFDARCDIYFDLRDKGYVVRPGLKFGADFAVYEKGPGIDHSPFIVQVMPRDSAISAVDMVRAGRLATSVKKKFTIANPNTRTYYVFRWFKP
ncbi:MAG: tRNA-intron lyase [Promethearchaeota archaeon]